MSYLYQCNTQHALFGWQKIVMSRKYIFTTLFLPLLKMLLKIVIESTINALTLNISTGTNQTKSQILCYEKEHIAGLNYKNFATSYTYLEQAAQQAERQVAHLFILLSCKIDIVCVWISNMDSIEICFQGFTNDVVGLNESIFYCQKIFWQKIYYLKSFCIKVQPRTTQDAAIVHSSQDHTKENTTELVMNCQCRRDHWFFGKTQIQRISIN